MSGETVSVTKAMNASAEQMWSIVTDLPQMGKWSPESVGGKWVKGATGPALGARLKGNNKNGIRRWSTLVTVTEADAPRRFAFQTSFLGLPIAEWTYQISPAGQGCEVTETWSDRRWGWTKPAAGLVSGVRDRASFTRGSIETTLENMAASLS